MALDVQTFKVWYRDFALAPNDLVAIKIAEAELRVSDAWGNKRDTIVALETAAELADSPQSRYARLEGGTNLYRERLTRERRSLAGLSKVG